MEVRIMNSEITCRESENTRFYFVMNFTDEKQKPCAAVFFG